MTRRLKSRQIRLLCAFSCLPAASMLKADPLTIVADPGPFETIEKAADAQEQVDWWDDNPADDAACTECFAAVELKHLLTLCTPLKAGEIALVPPEKMPATGDAILIGSGQTNPKIGQFKEAADDGFVAPAVQSFHIRVFREGNRSVTIIKGRDRIGAMYGAYGYAERLGMRFYGLGVQGTVTPEEPADLPAELDVAESPHYITRGFWAWEDRGNPDFFRWMARNRMNFWTVASVKDVPTLKKYGIKLTAGNHDIQYECLNPKTYFAAHPEWYCLRDGKRSDKITPEFGDNYCTSNPEATAELIKNLLNLCIDGKWKQADMINFWMLDGGKWCECEACKKQGTNTDRLMDVITETLRAFKKARADGRLKRKVEIISLAYHDTLNPPTRPLAADFDYDNVAMTFFPIERCYVHPFADPACSEINQLLATQYEGWTTGPGRAYTGSIFIGEYYNVSSLKSLPVLFPTIMAVDIPWYYRTGARHFHYMHTPTRLWGTWTLNQYLMGKLLWNTATDAKALVDEYHDRYYPTTSGSMSTFYAELEHATSNCKALKHYVYTRKGGYSLRGGLAGDTAPIFTLDHLRYDSYQPLVNDGPDLTEIVESMQRARRAIDDAVSTCKEEVERARVVEDERRFAYGEAMVLFQYHLVRTAMFHRDKQADLARREFEQVERQASILKGITDLVQVSSSHANAKDGLDASQLDQVYERYKKLYGAEK